MDLAELEDAINTCLDILYIKDHHLISNDSNDEPNHVSERSIVFRFGIYFEEFINRKLPEYNLDSEYNRNKADPKFLPSWKSGCYPDIIVHKRKSNDDNLLIIEFKTWWNSNQSDDKKKIEEFCTSGTYRYKYGVTVLLTKDRNDVDVNLYQSDKATWKSINKRNDFCKFSQESS